MKLFVCVIIGTKETTEGVVLGEWVKVIASQSQEKVKPILNEIIDSEVIRDGGYKFQSVSMYDISPSANLYEWDEG